MKLEVRSTTGDWFVPAVWDCLIVSETDWEVLRKHDVFATIRDLMIAGF